MSNLSEEEINIKMLNSSLEQWNNAFQEKAKENSDLQNRINKAIDFIENHIVATETEDILLKILKGE